MARADRADVVARLRALLDALPTEAAGVLLTKADLRALLGEADAESAPTGVAAPPAVTPGGTLAGRVGALVGERFGGNLRPAAKRADVAYSTFYEIATGKTESPSAATLDKIARALGTSPAFLLYGASRGPS